MNLGGGPVTPVTYELDGKQYVSILARAAPNTRLFTFVLDGTEPIPPDPAGAGKGGKGGGKGGANAPPRAPKQ